jgi:hypothetical protein
MSRTQTYIEQQLGATGFVLCAPDVAYRLRQDLWPTQRNCETDFGPEAMRKLTNRAPILFTFERLEGRGYGGCFNPQRLEDRVLELYGIEITVNIVDSLNQTPADARSPAGSDLREQERLQELKILAGEELPGHDCPKRHEIIEARRKLSTIQ